MFEPENRLWNLHRVTARYAALMLVFTMQKIPTTGTGALFQALCICNSRQCKGLRFLPAPNRFHARHITHRTQHALQVLS